MGEAESTPREPHIQSYVCVCVCVCLHSDPPHTLVCLCAAAVLSPPPCIWENHRFQQHPPATVQGDCVGGEHERQKSKCV